MGRQGKTTGGIGPLSVADLSNPSPSWRDFLKGWKNFFKLPGFFRLKSTTAKRRTPQTPQNPVQMATWWLHGPGNKKAH
jgi:hypothetical protein